MNFKSILIVGLSLATVGLSLPAHAKDTATVIHSDQDAIVTGDNNNTSQENTTRVSNSERGRRTTTDNNTGTSIDSRQSVDVQGRYNHTTQINDTQVTNSRRNVR